MKNLLIAAFLLLCTAAFAQKEGVYFQNNLTWAQVREKAEKENKYIFVDCYTTWCVPCKVMAKEILPQPEVSSFLNDNLLALPCSLIRPSKMMALPNAGTRK